MEYPMSHSEINMLYQKASKLSDEEQLKLISKLADSLQKTHKKNKHKLSELQGLGKKIWKNVEAEGYIKNLREEWHD